MAAPLTLVDFDVDDNDPVNLTITLKGTARNVPASVNHTKGKRGTRVATLSVLESDALYELGEALQLPDAIEFEGEAYDPDAATPEGSAAEYYTWFRNFVPSNQGGVLPVEDADEDDDEDDDEDEIEDEESEEIEVEETEPEPTREEELTPLAVKELKVIADELTEAGFECPVERKKADTIANIVAAEAARDERWAELDAVLDTGVKAAKAHIADIDDVVYLKQLAEREGYREKPRATLLKAITEIVKALTAPEPKAAPPAPAPPKPKGKKQQAKGKAKGTKKPKAPKAPKKPKGPSEEEVQAAKVIEGVKEALRSAFRLLKSGRKTRLAVSELIAKVEEEETGIVSQPKGKKQPLYHHPGRVWSTTKNHRNGKGWGVCTYKAKCLEGGGYKIVAFEGARTDIEVGAEFPNANALLRLLTGRDYPRVQVYRYFDSYEDPKTK